MNVYFFWHNYKYFPYEQELAFRELAFLSGQVPRAFDEGFFIENAENWRAYANRLTYFGKVAAEDGSQAIPIQAVLEASSNSKYSLTLSNMEEPLPLKLNRQSTRYSSHGLHEYKGKFNPQIVRVIGNIIGLKPGSWLLDPFCGSGTTLLEAIHNGWNGVGIELNPLGIEIARAKVSIMHLSNEEIVKSNDNITECLSKRIENISLMQEFSEEQCSLVGDANWCDRLPNFEYLSSWFPRSVLAQISAILAEINSSADEKMRDVYKVILSDSLRDVSLQDPRDLRIRRRKNPLPNYPVISLFLSSLNNKVKNILQAKRYIGKPSTMQIVLLGDSRQAGSVIQKNLSNQLFDAAITSPPYATALPYIDTQRLSLVSLGLIEPEEIRTMEHLVSGSREITNRQKISLEAAINENRDSLPTDCLQLCRDLLEALGDSDGFRRQNVPALMYRYFSDMSKMFLEVSSVLKDNALFALVVGTNQTSLGGRKFNIDTPYYLANLGLNNGFSLEEMIKLDTYKRYDIHQANSINSETLIILKRNSNEGRNYPAV